MLYEERPDASHLRTWGCVTFALVPPESRQRKEKLQPRTKTCLFLGYSTDTKGYKMPDLQTGAVTTHRLENMRFEEAVTVEHTYITQLIENAFMYGEQVLPPRIPYATMESVVDDIVTSGKQMEMPLSSHAPTLTSPVGVKSTSPGQETGRATQDKTATKTSTVESPSAKRTVREQHRSRAMRAAREVEGPVDTRTAGDEPPQSSLAGDKPPNNSTMKSPCVNKRARHSETRPPQQSRAAPSEGPRRKRPSGATRTVQGKERPASAQSQSTTAAASSEGPLRRRDREPLNVHDEERPVSAEKQSTADAAPSGRVQRARRRSCRLRDMVVSAVEPLQASDIAVPKNTKKLCDRSSATSGSRRCGQRSSHCTRTRRGYM